MKYKSLVLLFILSTLASCSIHKRHYSKGYYFDWNHSASIAHKIQQKSKQNQKLTAQFAPSSTPTDSMDLVAENQTNKHLQSTHSISFNKLDTVPEKTQSTLYTNPELEDQLEQDQKHIEAAVATLLLSIASFIGGVALVLGPDVEIEFLFLGLGFFGFLIGLVLLIIFIGIKNSHRKLLKNEKRISEEQSNQQTAHDSKTPQEKSLAILEEDVRQTRNTLITFTIMLFLGMFIAVVSHTGIGVLFGLIAFIGGTGILISGISLFIKKEQLRKFISSQGK